jgi:hypothetical protein
VENDKTIAVEQRETEPVYERPTIKDYGTLAELTAGKDSGRADFLGGQEDGGGGYS